MQKAVVWLNTARFSYSVLFIWILMWNAWINPPYPAAPVLLFTLSPLLLLLRGLLYARNPIFIWISLLMPFYFALGVSHAYVDSPTRIYGYGLALFSVLLFTSAIGTARCNRSD